jgi:CRP/FNR family transcriptional regulator, polysaccharide utilization system transcription regulator
MLEEFNGLKDDGLSINISLTREDIAGIIGTTTESLIRILAEFRNNQWIDLKEKELKLLNREQLYHIANNSV